MKGRPVDQLVYECMFPKPKPTDPPNFQGLLSRQLVPEVRLETQAFYGHLSSQEAKYPGLDYSYKPHRVRLARYQWHRRLFRAFDNLGLTKSEIASLTKWEGTRWAKERFEREQGIVIRDTTGDGIRDWIEPERRKQTDTRDRHTAQAELAVETLRADGHELGDDADDSDMELHESVGIELNRRLRAAAAQREAGNLQTAMDEEYEQWLKDAAEAGAIPDLSPNARIPGTRPAPEPPAFNPSPSSQEQSSSSQIPDFLQNMIRESIGTANVRMDESWSSHLPQPTAAPPSQNNPASAFIPGFSPRMSTIRPLNPRPSGRQTDASMAPSNPARFERFHNSIGGRSVPTWPVRNIPSGGQTSAAPSRTNVSVAVPQYTQEGRGN